MLVEFTLLLPAPLGVADVERAFSCSFPGGHRVSPAEHLGIEPGTADPDLQAILAAAAEQLHLCCRRGADSILLRAGAAALVTQLTGTITGADPWRRELDGFMRRTGAVLGR